MDSRPIRILGHLASRFTEDRDNDIAVVRGTIESLYKARTSEALLKNIDSQIDYTFELIVYARINQSEMKRLFP